MRYGVPYKGSKNQIAGKILSVLPDVETLVTCSLGRFLKKSEVIKTMAELTPQTLAKLNQFTRRTHTAEEVYVFDVILCDNEVDRDLERFSDAALQQLKTLFVGKAGVFDHNPSGKLQTARIFETELETIPGKQTTLGEPYLCLKAHAYMIRTEGNRDLIQEIEGGIKKRSERFLYGRDEILFCLWKKSA